MPGALMTKLASEVNILRPQADITGLGRVPVAPWASFELINLITRYLAKIKGEEAYVHLLRRETRGA